jgi:hypothetical protein
MDRSITPVLALTLVTALGIGWGTLSPPGQGASPLPFTDKQLHFMAFALLALPLGWARPRWVLWLVPVSLGYGAMIELIQPAVGRSGEWGDLLADGLGILAGVLPGQIRHRLQQKRQ